MAQEIRDGCPLVLDVDGTRELDQSMSMRPNLIRNIISSLLQRRLVASEAHL